MFETHYKKPLVYAVALSLLILLPLAYSLTHSGGGGSPDDTHITFDLPNVEVAEEIPEDTTPPAPVESPAQPTTNTVAESTGQTSPEPVKSGTAESKPAEQPKPSSESKSTGPRWAGIRPDETSDEPVVKSAPKTNKTNKDTDADIGNGTPDVGETVGDLSFLSPLSLSLLSEGHREMLIPTTKVNAKEFVEHVQQQAKKSHLTGNVRVHTNFDVNGNVVSTRITDEVDASLKQEAERIVQTSGTIINNSNGVVYLYIPVTLGQ